MDGAGDYGQGQGIEATASARPFGSGRAGAQQDGRAASHRFRHRCQPQRRAGKRGGRGDERTEVKGGQAGGGADANGGDGGVTLAENLRVPIVPMRLDGVWKMKRAGRRLAHIGEITVRIGKPVTFPPGTPPNEIALSLASLVKSL